MLVAESLTPEDWRIVGQSALFGRLDPGSAQSLVGENAVLVAARGATICRQDEPAAFYFIVLSGLIKLFRRAADGSIAIISIHGPSQSFMEAEALTGATYSTTAEAVVEARVARIDAEALRRRIGADSKLALALLGSASMHLRTLLEQIEKLKTMTATARLADFILLLAGPKEGRAEISLPYEKRLVAGHLGMTPESFSRTLGQLRKLGVRVQRDKVTIDDIGRLRDYCEGEE
ncbi:MAG TPA: Crp/Fnr family transcriptional regulator [Rhodoblastus sp.]|nr:Crp/Fnr family transcriptional regulator [Rhodoblastus sp.]